MEVTLSSIEVTSIDYTEGVSITVKNDFLDIQSFAESLLNWTWYAADKYFFVNLKTVHFAETSHKIAWVGNINNNRRYPQVCAESRNINTHSGKT